VNDPNDTLDQAEEKILTASVSDEVLEAAADKDSRYTYFNTGDWFSCDGCT
jgi:hypothetical protein